MPALVQQATGAPRGLNLSRLEASAVTLNTAHDYQVRLEKFQQWLTQAGMNCNFLENASVETAVL